MTLLQPILPDTSFNPNQLVIRPLTADDGLQYRALRQHILEIGDGRYFSDSYEREKTFVTDQQWRDWCTEKREHCTIGIFMRDKLIGIMGIIQYGPPVNSTVEWEVTWLDPAYRKYGIAKLAYQKVWDWTVEHGYDYAVVFIRADNQRSREIREKQGAKYFYTKRNEHWADGSVADVHCFIIDLNPAVAEESAYGVAARRMESILATFKGDKHDPDKKIAVNGN